MATKATSFPGVYPTVRDDSFTTPLTSRFKAGLCGVATKGPFNTATSCRSLKDFRRNFGVSISNRYMANAAAVLADVTDGLVVVRVGRQYESKSTGDASGTTGTYEVFTPKAPNFSVGDYVRVSQPGKKTTVNARVVDVPGTNDRLTLDSTTSEAVALAATYSNANVDCSPVSGAANEAETCVYAYQYDAQLTLAGDVVGDKNAYQFTVNGDQTLLAAGDLIKIEQSGLNTTREVRIKEVQAKIGGVAVIKLDTSNNTEIGYQALPLQDSYTAGRISKVTVSAGEKQTTLAIQFLAASAGTWANSDGVSTGLMLNIRPGSKPDTKKIEVLDNGGVVESIDNLTTDASSADYYVTRIQGLSSYIDIPTNLTVSEHPANTVNPWNATAATALNLGAFTGGSNGDSPSADEIVGTIDPSDDSQTGLKVFDDPEVDFDFLYAPDVAALFSSNDVAIAQEVARICRKRYAVGIRDCPQGLNLREATDYHNGDGLYGALGKIDDAYTSFYWNWITISDTFIGEDKVVPPGIGALYCHAVTFDNFKPWYAAAGEIRGVITPASAVEFERVAIETRDASYGDGNAVNPVLLQNGRILMWGDRTMQRTESKLTARHNLVLVNHIVKNLSIQARQFVFDPNDQTLLDQMNITFSKFMDGVLNERGVEDYSLNIEATAADRNARQVRVNVDFIPVDAVERIFINATVRESGADLNSVA